MAGTISLKNPFVGLRSFEANEGYLFFGRSSQTNYILKRFKQNRFLAAVGSSGSGKSSLIKSGTIPAIYAGFLETGKNWHVASIRPGTDPNGSNPIKNLAHELAKEGMLYKGISTSEFPYESIIETTLRRSNLGLINVFKEAQLPPTENLLIVVDQFEEIFRFNQKEKEKNDGISDATHFINILLEASKQEEYPIYILITLRADFLGDCSMFRGLPEVINEGQYLVPRMTREEIRDAITSPVAIAGASISARLVTKLLNDVGDDNDQLPVLQHALMRTWDAWIERNQPESPIDLEDYVKIGELSKALSQHADEAYSELKTDRQREICASIFKALSSLSTDGRRIRRPTSVDKLSKIANAKPSEIIEVIEVFRKDGRAFLMPPPEVPLDEFTTIDLTHESIMRIWDKLKIWNKEELESAELYRDISEDAILHKTIGKPLWTDPILALGLKWYKENKPNAEWAKRYYDNFEEATDFLFKSEKEDKRIKRSRRKKLIMQLLLGVLAICFLIFVSTMMYFQREIKYNEKIIEGLRKTKNIDLFDKVQLINVIPVANNNSSDHNTPDTTIHLNINYYQIANGKTKSGSFNTSFANPFNKLQQPVDTLIIHDTKIKTNTLVVIDKRIKKQVAIMQYHDRLQNNPINPRNVKTDTVRYSYVINALFYDTLELLRNRLIYEKLYTILMYSNDCKEATKRPFYKTKDQVKSGESNLEAAMSGMQPPDKGVFKVKSLDPDSKYILSYTSTGNVLVYNYPNPGKPFWSFMYGGSNITSLTYDSYDQRIYYGLPNGDVGYKNKKNNNLGFLKTSFKTDIVAIDFMLYKNSKYLLVASNNQIYVYEMSDECNSIYNEQELTGVSPKEELSNITDAWFDRTNSTVIIKCRNKYYVWNPFALSLLNNLNDCLKSNNKTLYNKISKDNYIEIAE